MITTLELMCRFMNVNGWMDESLTDGQMNEDEWIDSLMNIF